jgi:hypothetical protein
MMCVTGACAAGAASGKVSLQTLMGGTRLGSVCVDKKFKGQLVSMTCLYYSSKMPNGEWRCEVPALWLKSCLEAAQQSLHSWHPSLPSYSHCTEIRA